MTPEFRRDDQGILRATIPDCEALAEFLEQEVGEHNETAQAWQDRARTAAAGWHASGNAYRIAFTASDVRIASLFANPPLECTLPRTAFLDTLHLWRSQFPPP